MQNFEDIETLLKKLKAEIESYNKTIIALSGGVDSCLASFLCRKYLGKGKFDRSNC